MQESPKQKERFQNLEFTYKDFERDLDVEMEVEETKEVIKRKAATVESVINERFQLFENSLNKML